MRQMIFLGTMRHLKSFKKELQMARIGIFAYGIFSYAVFFAVFLYGIGFIGGFLTPNLPFSTAAWRGRGSRLGGSASCRKPPNAAPTCY
jgi:hypothetical protein